MVEVSKSDRLRDDFYVYNNWNDMFHLIFSCIVVSMVISVPRTPEGRVIPPAHLQPLQQLPSPIGGSSGTKKKKKKKKKDQHHGELAPVAGPVPPPRGYASPTLPPPSTPPQGQTPSYPLKSAMKKRTPSPAPVEREQS